jgi:hypothetical protein
MGNSNNCLFERLRIYNNGNTGLLIKDNNVVDKCNIEANKAGGLNAGKSCIIINCIFINNDGDGVTTKENALITGCSSNDNHVTGDGFDVDRGSSLENCSTRFNNGAGIRTNSFCKVSNCISFFSNGSGINAGDNSMIAHCAVEFGNADGIILGSFCSAIENHCNVNGTGGATGGIHTAGIRNRIESNALYGNLSRGLKVDGAENLIIRNTVGGSGVNYEIGANNRYGPIVDISAAGTAAVAGNTAASTVVTTHPWANFTH